MSDTNAVLEPQTDDPANLDQDILTDHSYDGIQEYDNPLPGWWRFLFVASVVYAFLYWGYYHMGAEGRSILDRYDRQADKIYTARFAEIGDLEPNRETLLKYMNDEKWLTVGRVIFKANCVSCHGANGEGKVGPNLTDDYYKNITKIEDIFRVIENGAANGSMPAWKNRLSHINQRVLTAAYIASLRGKNLPGKSRLPEDKRIPPWDTE